MPEDERSLIQKVEAVLDPNSGATEGERVAAGAALERLRAVPAARKKATRALTREAVAAAPGSDSPAARGVRVRMPSGRWEVYDEDQVSWEMVEAHHLRWHYVGDPPDMWRSARDHTMRPLG